MFQVNKQPAPDTNVLNTQVYMFTLQLFVINRYIFHVHAVHEKQSQGMVYFHLAVFEPLFFLSYLAQCKKSFQRCFCWYWSWHRGSCWIWSILDVGGSKYQETSCLSCLIAVNDFSSLGNVVLGQETYLMHFCKLVWNVWRFVFLLNKNQFP